MKVTIITVVKNDIKNISSTIKSVIEQSYKNLEYILIDGYSIDGTYEKILKEKKKNQKKINIKVYRKADKNLYEGLNRGIKYATGDIIGLLHSGDKFFNKNVVTLITKKFNQKINLISGNVIYKNKNKIVRLWDYNVKNLSLNSSFKIAHTSLFLHRKLLKKIGNYNLNYTISSDTEFIFRLSENKHTNYLYLNKFLIIMSINGLSTSFKSLIKKLAEDLNIYFRFYGILFIFFYIYKIYFKLINLIIWKFLR